MTYEYKIGSDLAERCNSHCVRQLPSRVSRFVRAPLKPAHVWPFSGAN